MRGLCTYVPGGDSLYLFIRFGLSRAAAAQQRTVGPQTRHLLLHLRLTVWPHQHLVDIGT